jgi:hypothetical protein
MTQARMISQEFGYIGAWVPYDTPEAARIFDAAVKQMNKWYGAGSHQIETR